MQLYTVKLANKHIISCFDTKGKKIGERTDTIVQTICDLPHQTAMMYKSKDGDRCTVIAQEVARKDARRTNIQTREARQSASKIIQTKKSPTASPSRQSSNMQQAAMRGDMSAAISRGD